MDLRAYYKKLREIERAFGEEFVVVKSLATPDGGIAGRLAEVTRAVAAKMIADGMTEAASDEETAAYRRAVAEAKAEEDERRAGEHIQVTLVPGPGLREIRGVARRGRKG